MVSVTETQTTPIKGQDSAYRRGMILGLTMAEIMLLIVFMLLLTFGMLVATRERAIKDLNSRLASFHNVQMFLAELQKERPSVSITDIVQKISRQQTEVTKLRDENELLQKQIAADTVVQDIIKKIQRDRGTASSSEVVRELGQMGKLKSEALTDKGQIAQLTSQIKASGKGNEFPSCWVTTDGKQESIYEFVLSADGITVANHNVPGRESDRADLPIQNVPIGREVSFQEFSQAMLPLYQWSVQHGCRFYVLRYSAVASAPVEGLNQIDLKFYPDSRIMRVGK
jgi:hypothetical protein